MLKASRRVRRRGQVARRDRLRDVPMKERSLHVSGLQQHIRRLVVSEVELPVGHAQQFRTPIRRCREEAVLSENVPSRLPRDRADAGRRSAASAIDK